MGHFEFEGCTFFFIFWLAEMNLYKVFPTLDDSQKKINNMKYNLNIYFLMHIYSGQKVIWVNVLNFIQFFKQHIRYICFTSNIF